LLLATSFETVSFAPGRGHRGFKNGDDNAAHGNIYNNIIRVTLSGRFQRNVLAGAEAVDEDVSEYGGRGGWAAQVS
jgi:hypothetical protein